MSSIIKTRAFVLSKLDYGDTSKIVNFYSEKYGRITGIIKGARASKSKVGKAVDILNLVELVFYKKENRDIQVVTQADLLQHYSNIKSDLEKLKYSSSIIELVLKLTLDDDPHPKLFIGLEKILKRINDEKTPPILLFALFYKFFINEIGYGIELEKCSECEKSLKGSGKVFYNYESGFFCNSCSNNHITSFSFSSELFSKIICLSQRNKNCSYNDNELASIITFFEKFLVYHIDEFTGLKSLQIY